MPWIVFHSWDANFVYRPNTTWAQWFKGRGTFPNNKQLQWKNEFPRLFRSFQLGDVWGSGESRENRMSRQFRSFRRLLPHLDPRNFMQLQGSTMPASLPKYQESPAATSVGPLCIVHCSSYCHGQLLYRQVDECCKSMCWLHSVVHLV